MFHSVTCCFCIKHWWWC